MADFWTPSQPVLALIARAALIYGAVFVLLRIGGKREIGEMSPAEFVGLLLVSNAVENAMNGGDESATGGLILAATLIGITELIAYLSFRSDRVAEWLEGSPSVLVRNGRAVPRNLVRNHVSMRELESMLRQQGVESLGEVRRAVLEPDGAFSVIKKKG